MKFISLLLSLALSGSLTLISGVAHADPPNIYIRSNGQFVANGNEYARGFWVPAIRGADDAFSGNALALQEYRDHIDDARWFGILAWGSIGALATYGLISSANDNYQGSVGLVIFLVPWIASVVMAAKSNRHLLKAINLMNGVPATEAYHPYVFPSEEGRQRYSLAKPLEIPLLAWTF